MASKFKHCKMCGKKCVITEMVKYEESLFCDDGCVQLYKECYEGEEVKPIAKRVEGTVQ